ncbi:MAG: hypothetical protein QM831_36650 [Kofleriaceae bacterium]
MRINPTLFFALALPISSLACTDDPTATDPEVETIASCGLDGTITLGSGSPKTAQFTTPGSQDCGALVKVNMAAATAKIIGGMVCPESNHITAFVNAGEWGLMSDGFDDDQTECNNSKLTVTVKDSSGAVIASKWTRPQWTGTECGFAGVGTIDVSDAAGSYTVSAVANRGLAVNNHGFAKTVVSASRTSSCN